jgi:hypothetical protein
MRSFPARALFSLLFISLVLNCGRIISESEDNGTFETANILQESPGAGIRGIVSGSQDTDIFKLETAPAQNIPGMLTAVIGSNALLSLVLTKDRIPFKKFFMTARDTSLFFGPVTADPNHPVHVIISSAAPGQTQGPSSEPAGQEQAADNVVLSVPYTLRFYPLASADTWETEPDDTPALAMPVEPGKPVSGFYAPATNFLTNPGVREEDWYKVEIGQDEIVMQVSVTAVPDVDPVISLFDAGGRQIKTMNDNGPSDGESLLNAGIRNKGIYYIRLFATNACQNTRVPYSLLVSLSTYDRKTEFEDNDTPDTANLLSSGNPIHGYISPKGDKDWYKIFLPGDRRYLMDLTLTGVDGLDLKADVYDNTFKLIRSVDQGKAGMPESWPNIPLSTRYAYVAVSAEPDKSSDQAYVLTAITKPWDNTMEFDSDKKIPDIIETGVDITGYIEEDGDTDPFLFRIRSQGGYSVRITPPVGTEIIYDLFQSDRNGQRKQELAESEKGSRQIRLQNGYYLLVLHGSRQESRAPYHFIVEKK